MPTLLCARPCRSGGPRITGVPARVRSDRKDAGTFLAGRASRCDLPAGVNVFHEGERGRGVVVVAHGFFESQERVVNRPVFLRGLCNGVEARVGVPEGLFARLR